MLVVNFKTYGDATGEKAEELAEKCARASGDTGARVVAAPSLPETSRIAGTEAETFSQHLDPVDPGSHTGHVTAENLNSTGVSGTLLNHSERRIEPGKIEKAIGKARDQSLETIVCAKSPDECEKFSSFKPDYIAFEPPELIGGDTSVSKAKPGMIEEAVERSTVPVLTGAGIHAREDVEKSVELGCEGILVASAVVKAENQLEEIKELCRGL